MSAFAARLEALIVTPVGVGTLTIAGVIADPALGAKGQEAR
jgi:hypothetical protein